MKKRMIRKRLQVKEMDDGIHIHRVWTKSWQQQLCLVEFKSSHQGNEICSCRYIRVRHGWLLLLALSLISPAVFQSL